MEYQTLYRAWRPKQFKDIVGQEPIVTTLTNQILTGHIAHAYLFCGSRGTGKTSTAKVFARAINCMDSSTGAEPCGECESCRQLLAESSLDVIEIDAASNNGVDEIRDLRDKVKYLPTIGKYKVYIIDEVHMLSSGAFNALLKTLEEPPAHVVFILATTEPQKLPATILSRCQRFDFKRFTSQTIVKRLREALPDFSRPVDEDALFAIARASEGGMRDAWNLLEMCVAYDSAEGRITESLVREVLGASDRGCLFAFADALLASDAGKAIVMIGDVMRDGRDAAVFAREVAEHMRSLLLAQVVEENLGELLDITQDDAARYAQQAQNAASEVLRRDMDIFIGCEADMRYASHPRIVLELAAVRACRPEKEKTIEALEQRVAQLEKALAEGVRVAPKAAAPAKDKPAPAKPKEAKPAAKAAPAAAIEGKEEWDSTVKMLQENEKGVYPLISEAIFKGVDENTVRIEIPKKKRIYLTILQNADKTRVVEQYLEKAFGSAMHLAVAAEGETKAPISRKGLEEIFDVFDRENVSVEDE